MNNQKGLTLIELIIVVVIMGVMFILTVPTFTSTSHSKLKSAVRDVATELQMARMKAIYRNMEYRVNLTLSSSTTTADTYIFQCKMSGGACSSSGSWPANTVADPERLNMASGAIALPLAVNVTETNNNDSGTVTIEFNPNGTSSSTAGLCFINRDLTTDVIKLCVYQGRVRTETATSCGACSS